MTSRDRLGVLCILDGWGYREDQSDNAVRNARTPCFDALWANEPHCFLRTDGHHVGLPDGQFGNSEVGHMNLGAGRVVMQDLPRINKAVEHNTIKDIQAFHDLIVRTRTTGGRVHILGLVSPGGVHAHQDHLAHLARCIDQEGIPCLIHAFLDGRDTPPRSAVSYLQKLQADIVDLNSVQLVSICGRYFAMDRDRRYERTQKALDAILTGGAEFSDDLTASIDRGYERGVTDEFIEPVCVTGYDGARDGDALLCVNFRADRARQILSALAFEEIEGVSAERQVLWSAKLGMVSYSESLDRHYNVLFGAVDLQSTMGEVIAAAGLPQTRIAETEKYPHVTFFFNGGREQPFELENRIMVPSPKVATYDLKPEMSAAELTERFLDLDQRCGLVLINFANPDMVGHTGDLQAAVKAVETVDACLGRIIEKIRAVGGFAIVTADHGNCELMRDQETGVPHTAHTTNPVPCILVNAGQKTELLDGKLADIAPTMLKLLGIVQPEKMTGTPLVHTQG